MYIYNVTTNIDESIHNEWVEWIKIHIKKMLDTKCFTSAKLTQVLVKEEMGGVTYSIQYQSSNRENLENYYRNYATEFQNEGMQKFGDKMLTFTTELKMVQQF